MSLYTFTDLLRLWRYGCFSLDEVIGPILQTMASFRDRTTRLDYKLLAFSDTSEETVDNLEEPYIDEETFDLIETLPTDETIAYKAIDHILSRFAVMEIKLVKMERDYERIARKMDTKLSHLN